MARRFDKLSRDRIRKLKPGERITEHGITAECLKDGDIRYSVNIMVDGERIHRVIGRASEGTTRTQAEDFIEKTRSDAREDRLHLPKGRKIALTFKAAAELYLDMMRQGGGKNMEEKERHFKHHLNPELGKMPIDKISDFTLKKLRRSMTETRGLSEGTFINVYATYRHMGNTLYREKRIRKPLATLDGLGTPDNRREYVLSRNEKENLLDAALKDSNTRIWLFVMMGLNTGLRHSEILSARYEHLDVDRRRLRVRVKGGRWREQPLTRAITRILQNEREMADDDEEWVFPNPRSKSGHVDSMKKAFRRVVGCAGLDPAKVIPHTMRHTAITDLSETGADFQTIQAFSGHKSNEMVMRYVHARTERVNDALDAFETGTNIEHIGEPNRRRS
jgi:integrase